jgi:hypothetical protein
LAEETVTCELASGCDSLFVGKIQGIFGASTLVGKPHGSEILCACRDLGRFP